MERYRVLFTGNKAIAATKTNWETNEILKLHNENGKKYLDWFIVYGDDESDAIQAAEDVIKESLHKFLG